MDIGNLLFYNKHYITVDDQGRITDGWSDGPRRDKPTEGAICINDRGGYQFRLIIDKKETEENPPLWTMDGIPLYKYVDGAVQERTEEEIEADRALIPPPPPSETEKLRADMDYIAIMSGIEL